MENLEYYGGHRPSKELRIGGIFTEDQYQLDTIQVSSVIITFAGDKLYGTYKISNKRLSKCIISAKKKFFGSCYFMPRREYRILF